MSAADNPAVMPAGENGLSYASGPGRWVLLVTALVLRHQLKRADAASLVH